MTLDRIRRAVAPTALVASVVLACGACAAGSPRDGPRVEMTVFAASSLSDVVPALAQAYERMNAGVSLTLAFDGSSLLRARIEQGAPADVFLSADATGPQILHDAGLAAAPITFAANHLAIAVPESNPSGIAHARDLARPGLRIIGVGASVPISAYARELLDRIGARPDAPAGYAAAVEANIVSREDNVRAAVAKTQLGEGDAAIVYATDLRGTNLRSIPLPAGIDVETRADVVAVGSSPRPAAVAFVAWILGPEARSILVAHGFSAPS